MTTAVLPIPLSAPAAGWRFAGAWRAPDQARIEQSLRERIPNPARARHDPWVFLVHAATYYAHSPAFHRVNVGFSATTADALADLLWDHYFSLQLGPLAWSPPTEAAPPTMAPTVPAADVQTPADPLIVRLEQEWQALEHFEAARALLADGDYAAAKWELERSLACYPATSFFDHKRLETLGDIESSLGNDTAALLHYQRSLELALTWQESWVHSELRLKLAWVFLRLGQIEAAHELAEIALATCRDGAADATNRRGVNYATALALATLADVAFHQHNSDAAIGRARQAAAVAMRLGQAYAEKVRLLTYLAWQLYHHDETTEARAVAQRAQAALDRWMPLDARHVRALRTTLATILGPAPQRSARIPRVRLPAHAARVGAALAAARAMQDWLRQLTTLHALAPYLTSGQVIAPLTDILVWREDVVYEWPERVVLTADLAHALAGSAQTRAAAADQLVALAPHAFRTLGHEWLYADSLVRLRGQLEPAQQKRIDAAISACALAWCDTIQGRLASDGRVNILAGLAVLLPQLPREIRQSACGVMEAALLAQLDPQQSLYPTAFLACLPVLARCNAGQRVVDALLQRDQQPIQLWIACLAHIAAEATRESIIEAALRVLETRLSQGSSSEVAAVVCVLAPYARGEQARRALALATCVRAIAPRARALAAIASALPDDERQVVYEQAWTAAQRSANADVRGEALAAIVVSMAAPRFGQHAADGVGGDGPVVV